MTSWPWPFTICCGSTLDPENSTENANGRLKQRHDGDVAVEDINGDDVVEQQPLRRQRTDSWSAEATDRDDTIKKLQKKTKLEEQVSNILCCARQPLREDQVDLCPRVWWNVFWTYDGGRQPDGEPTQTRPVKDICWHLLFLCFCLPCCYPCYLTKTLRHRRRRVARLLDVVPTSSDAGVAKPLDDDLNRTIYRTVSNTKSRCRALPANNNNNVKDDDGDDEEKRQQNVIQVNVIILQSATSLRLERHLYGDDGGGEGGDENDGVASVPCPPQNPSPVVFRHRKVSTQPNLNVVKEAAAERDDGVVVAGRRKKQSVSIQAPARRTSVLRRWSQLGQLGNSVARMSRRLKKTEEEEVEVDRFHDASNNEGEEEEEAVALRRDQRDRQTIEANRKMSRSSVYYSFDGENAPPDNGADAVAAAGEEVNREPEVQMKSVDKRIEIVKDLGFQLSFNVFDEASVAEWKGRDLRLANQIPDIDLIVIAVQKGNTAELEAIMNLKTGIMSYLSRFWRGFYPLLLIEVQSKDCSIEDTTEYGHKLEKLCKFFGDVHHIKIFEDTLDDQLDWIDECLGRLFIHSRIFQCSRFFGNVLLRFEKCPGGCGLRKRKNRTKLSRQRAKMTRFKSLYRKPRGPI